MAIHARTPHPYDVPRISYAQNAEDILIDRLFCGAVGTYMDIGSCHRVCGWAVLVFDAEPLPADHPFRTLENVLATPHIGSALPGTQVQ